MQPVRMRKVQVVVAFLAGLLGCGFAYAEKPDHAGRGGRGGQHDRAEKGLGGKGGGGHQKGVRDDGARLVTRFETRERTVIREYFVREGSAGRCPPGLAKKGNGCRPPGLAKKWSVGRALPRDVVYYDLPPALVVELGVPPAGHKFVRVAGDILMIAVGTSMVVDAIEDLGGL